MMRCASPTNTVTAQCPWPCQTKSGLQAALNLKGAKFCVLSLFLSSLFLSLRINDQQIDYENLESRRDAHVVERARRTSDKNHFSSAVVIKQQ